MKPVVPGISVRHLLSVLILVQALLTLACGSGGPEPSSIIPAESDAWVVIGRTDQLAVRLRPVVEVIPEAAGAVDLLRSMTGINPVDPAQTAESGLDPRRGAAVALWRGGTLIVLPVDDVDLAGRRIGLRMARFGFVESDPASGVRIFNSGSGEHACLVVRSGVAAVFVGSPDLCADVPGLIEKGRARDGNVENSLTASVTSELGMNDADVVAWAENGLFAARLMGALGLPVRGPAAYVVQGMVGDARAAVRIGRTIQVRAAAGAVGDTFEPVAARPSVRGDDAIRVVITADKSTGPLIQSAIAMCGNQCRRLGISTLADMWDGYATVNVPASVADSANVGGVYRPIVSVSDFFKRVNVFMTAGTGGPAARTLAVLQRQLPQVPDLSMPPASTDPGNVAGTPASVQAGGGVPSSDQVSGPASDETVPAPVRLATRILGIDVAIQGRDNAIFAATGPGAVESVSKLAGAGQPVGNVTSSGGRLVTVDVSPAGVLQVSGASNLDYLRHLVDPVRSVELDLYLQEGRLVGDGRINIR